ncbi:MAG: hypothetical protein Q7J68_00470, partial [Thermoplasmata archaeon]|nr:hypothetical protein [Thermoplasmata archaeon]
MDPMWIQIYITVDDSMLVKTVDNRTADCDTNGDGKWNVGEYWKYLITTVPEAPSLNSTSTFSITIVDQERNTLVWHETLGEGANFYKPLITRVWIDSDLATPQVDDPGPIGFEKPFKVYAEIIDPDITSGQGLNKSNLWVNLSTIGLPLFQLNDTVDSRDAVNDDIYVAVCNGPAKMSVGYYFFVFNATDLSGQTTQRNEKFPVGMIVG